MVTAHALRRSLERDPRAILRLVRRDDLSELPRRLALEAEYGASFTSVSGECVGHIPSVRLAPGPHGVRSVTVHGESWGEVLDWLEEIIDFPPGGGNPAVGLPGGKLPDGPGG